LEKKNYFPPAGFSHASAPQARRLLPLPSEAAEEKGHGAGGSGASPGVPCPAPLMTLLRSWAAAAADAAIVSLTIIQILDLLVTEAFFVFSS